jgi:hypothetical protein
MLRRMTARAFFALLALWFTVMSIPAQLHDEANHKRIFEGQTVDIQPAIEWHQEQLKLQALQRSQTNRLFLKPLRPLPMWGLVEGNKTNEYAWGGWRVVGRIDGVKAAFVLKDPPLAEFEEFTQLQKETSPLRARLTGMPHGPGTSEIFRPVTTTEARAGKSGYNEAAAKEAGQAFLERLSVSQEIAKKSKGYDLNKDFPVRCFARRTGQMCEGLPIFDRGVIPKETTGSTTNAGAARVPVSRPVPKTPRPR